MWDKAKTGHDFAFGFINHVRSHGSTVIPESLMHRLGAHASGKGTYKLEPTIENPFGLILEGDFIRAPEKFRDVGTIQVVKGGMKVEEEGRTQYYADFNTQDPTHAEFHLHPKEGKGKWLFGNDFDKIKTFFKGKISPEFKEYLDKEKILEW